VTGTVTPPRAAADSRWGAGRRRTKAARDEEFTAFVASAGTPLRRSAYLMCRDWHLAQDLTQSALTKVYLAWSRIGRDGADRYAYARTVLLRLVLDHKRLRRSTEIAVERVPEVGQVIDPPEDRITLLRALMMLAPRDRAIVVLRYWEDQSVQATAEALGVSEDMVRSRSRRALGVLRQYLLDTESIMD